MDASEGGIRKTAVKKKKKPVRKIPRTNVKSDVKRRTPLPDPVPSDGVAKLWVPKEGDIDWETPTFIFLAKDEAGAGDQAKAVGIEGRELESIDRRGAYLLSMGERQSEGGDVEMSDREEELKFWMSDDHQSLYPYRPGTLIAARNEVDAQRLMEAKLQDLGLEDLKFNLQELEEEKAYMLANGGKPNLS